LMRATCGRNFLTSRSFFDPKTLRIKISSMAKAQKNRLARYG
jgi:hypothetical protein